MPLTKLDLGNLGTLDERIVLAFDTAVRTAVMDCDDRPGDKSPRIVTLEFKITPVVGEQGLCDGAEGEFQIKTKVPARKSKTYSFSTNRKGHLIFSSTSPDNVDQTTFDDVNPNSGEVER
jgi:hypothetical protein